MPAKFNLSLIRLAVLLSLAGLAQPVLAMDPPVTPERGAAQVQRARPGKVGRSPRQLAALEKAAGMLRMLEESGCEDLPQLQLDFAVIKVYSNDADSLVGWVNDTFLDHRFWPDQIQADQRLLWATEGRVELLLTSLLERLHRAVNRANLAIPAHAARPGGAAQMPEDGGAAAPGPLT